MNSDAEKPTGSLLFGCTIAGPADWPQAMVLAQSFRQFHPESQFFVLLLGNGEQIAIAPGIKVLGLTDINLPMGDEWRLPMLRPAAELANILQPMLLHTLLMKGAGAAAYFGHSAALFAPLSQDVLPDDENAVVATEPIRNANGDTGRSYVAVKPESVDGLRSWTKSIDNFPVHGVIRVPGFALAYWNLDPGTLTSSASGYEVGEEPLRLFDFRGYDSRKPHLLSRYQGVEPRILLSEYPEIARLCDGYRDKLIDAASSSVRPNCHDLDFLPSGLRIDERMQKVYRDALDLFRKGDAPEPPSPFGAPGEEGFLHWLNEPIDRTRKKVTRYMLAVREEREDIKAAFPDPLGADAGAFRDWYLLFGQHELDLPSALVLQNAPVDNASQKTAAAVNVAGYFRAELGLGVAARALVSALETAAIPFNTISFNATANRQDHPFVDRQAPAPYADINLLCVNPDQLPIFAEQTGPELRHGRYTIGVWFWEVEDFPKAFHDAFNYVDEIWVASRFMRQTFLKVSPKPVFQYLLPVLPPPIDPRPSRGDLGLPERFTFLFSFDLFSVLERKNPIGLIKAFRRAFPGGDGPVLVIKTINGDKRCLEMEKLKYAVRGRSDIIVRDGYLSEIENNTMTALADCYVSLHRSEGFGLTIAQAMALGKPVIATAYSGNMEFMTPENSYLCPSVRAEVGPEREPYPADSHWSDPDVEEAVQLLKHIFLHQEEARARGVRAAEDIRIGHSSQVAGPIIAERIATIRRRRGTARPFRSVGFLEDRLEALEARLKRTAEDTSNA